MAKIIKAKAGGVSAKIGENMAIRLAWRRRSDENGIISSEKRAKAAASGLAV
jgi:hypothetical protein